MQTRTLWTCAVLVVSLCLGQTLALHADSLTVKTQMGKVHGKTISDGKVKAFYGI